MRKASEAFDDLPVADRVIQDIGGLQLSIQRQKKLYGAALVLYIFAVLERQVYERAFEGLNAPVEAGGDRVIRNFTGFFIGGVGAGIITKQVARKLV